MVWRCNFVLWIFQQCWQVQIKFLIDKFSQLDNVNDNVQFPWAYDDFLTANYKKLRGLEFCSILQAMIDEVIIGESGFSSPGDISTIANPGVFEEIIKL